MAVPVIDFSKLNGEERTKTMAQIANGCEEWGFFQVLTLVMFQRMVPNMFKTCLYLSKLMLCVTTVDQPWHSRGTP